PGRLMTPFSREPLASVRLALARFRHVLSLVALLFVCAFLPHAAAQPKEDEPPPLFGEGFLTQRAALALIGESTGINSPLRQAVIAGIGTEIGCFETE